MLSSAQYRFRSQGAALDKTHLLLALEQVVLAHPALGMQIRTTPAGKTNFVRLRSIDLSQVVEFIPGPATLQDTLTSYLTRPFRTACDEALWRVGVLPDGVIVWMYHHAIADGQSSLAFHKAFLNALNSLPEDLPQPRTIIDLPPATDFLPPVEQMTDCSVSLWKLCHALYGLFAPASWKAGLDSWTANPVLAEPTVRTNIRLWGLNPSDSATLIALCRKHGSTVTVFLYVLTAEVLSRVIATHRPKDLETYKTFSSNVAISLRRFTGVSPDAICDSSSKFHRYVPITLVSPEELSTKTFGAFPWAKATAFRADLHKDLGTVRQEIGSMWYLFGHFREYFTNLLDRKREDTFTISNPGPFPVTKGEALTGDWSIGDMFFGQCDATCGAAFKVNSIGSASGAIGTTFTWGEGAIDDELAEAVCSTLR